MFCGLGARLLSVSALAVVAFLAGPGSAAQAHEERPAQFPDGTGSVPTYRPYPAPNRLVVCRPGTADRIASYDGELRSRNQALLAECRYDSIQDAINDVKVANSTIYVMPGVYTEDKYADSKPTGYCADLKTASDDPLPSAAYIGSLAGPDSQPLEAAEDSSTPVAISYPDQLRCPHNLNMIAIFGDRSPDDSSISCDSRWCGLQLEGTGANATDVVIDNKFRKLNAIRADRAGGVYFRNFTVQQAEFNSLYVMETDGFVVEHTVARANDEYGVLAFASDHGLIHHVDAYYNGDSGIYPGSASDVNVDNKNFNPIRYAVEVRHNTMHHNALGYSGTAGNSVYAHDNAIYDNGVGMATDSVFPGHPGLPQDHARFSANRVYGNNVNYYENVFDGTCDAPMTDRGYLDGVVCPVIAMPVGTGVLIAGGNYDSVDHNRIYDNWRYGTMQFWVPAPIRDDYDPTHLYDTSNHDHYVGNVMGIGPDGAKLHNGLDFWWDDEGDGNCWEGNTSSYGTPTSNSTLPRPSCETGGSVFTPGMPVKDAGFLTCTQYNRSDPVWQQPPGCEWLTSPTRPAGTTSVGLSLPRSPAPLGGAAALLPGLLALVSLLSGYALQRRHRRGRRAA